MADRTASWRMIAGAYGLSAVLVGAVAAHLLQEPQAAASVGQASLYQLIHAAALLAIARDNERAALLAKLGFTVGIALFSGSVIVRHLAGVPELGALAPFGGICLMAGWAGVILSAFGPPDRVQGHVGSRPVKRVERGSERMESGSALDNPDREIEGDG
jgi:uncharacterized membrane protein YgdD (TMEM256/DUF423 family)